MEDKRKYQRFELPFPVVYYPEGRVQQFEYSVLKNVSRGGLSMPTVSNIIKNGDVIKMEIKVDGEQCVSATGKVRWVKMFDREASPDKEASAGFLDDEEAGVEFVDVAEADIDRLLSAQRSSCRPAFFDL